MTVPHDTSPTSSYRCRCTHIHTGPCPWCTALFCSAPVPDPHERRIRTGQTIAITAATILGSGICITAIAAGIAYNLLPYLGLIGFAGVVYLVIDTLRKLAAGHRWDTELAPKPCPPDCLCVGCMVERHVDAWAVEFRRADES